MFCLDRLKVHQTLPGGGWRVLHTELTDFDVTDDAVIAWVTYKELDCGSDATWVSPLVKRGMLSDAYDYAYVQEYLRPDATTEDLQSAIANLYREWQKQRGLCKLPPTPAAHGLSNEVLRG